MKKKVLFYQKRFVCTIDRTEPKDKPEMPTRIPGWSPQLLNQEGNRIYENSPGNRIRVQAQPAPFSLQVYLQTPLHPL